MRFLAAFAFSLCTSWAAHASDWITLRPVPHAAPAEKVRLTEQGEHIVSGVGTASILPYLPDGAAEATAVIVIPGGGHRELWMDHEGYRVGAWLQAHGIAAFVLKYRLSREPGSTYTMQDELSDVQRAIRTVRHNASQWHVAPARIGVIGFSAGGELAILAGTAFDAGDPRAKDAVERESSRPAFMGLIYPAIPKDLKLPGDAPPAFILCGTDDNAEISEGAAALYLSLKHAGGSPEMHILAGTGHGFGIRAENSPSVRAWPDLFEDWLIGLAPK